MNYDFKINLGDEVKDTITAFSGVVISRCQWLYNCNTYGVRSKKLKDNIPQDLVYFDEPQLKIIKKKTIKSKRDTGGPEKKVLQTNR